MNLSYSKSHNDGTFGLYASDDYHFMDIVVFIVNVRSKYFLLVFFFWQFSVKLKFSSQYSFDLSFESSI